MSFFNPQISTAELYIKYRQLVFRTCLRYCKDSAIAEDQCQEVFVKIHQRSQSNRDDWGAWLYTLAVNQSLDYLRTTNRRAQILDKWHHHFEECHDDNASNHDHKKQVEEILKEADADTRSILIMHFADGISQGEVAKLMNYSRVTINNKIQNFRKKMKGISSILIFFLTIGKFISSYKLRRKL